MQKQLAIGALLRQFGMDAAAYRSQYLGSAGGFSGADFWRLESLNDHSLCVRRWPPNVTVNRVAEVHSVVLNAAEHGLNFLATPYRTNVTKTYVEFEGRILELADWLPGSADFQTNPSQSRLESAFKALAQFHLAAAAATGTTNTTPAGMITRNRRWFELTKGGLDGIKSAVLQQSSHPLAALALRCLPALQDQLSYIPQDLQRTLDHSIPVQYCLRDIRHDHVLFDGDSLTGIVDYDAIGVDSVAVDISRMAQELLENDRAQWDLALTTYTRHRELSATELELVAVLRRVNPILSLATWLEWIFIDRRDLGAPEPAANRMLQLANRFDSWP